MDLSKLFSGFGTDGGSNPFGGFGSMFSNGASNLFKGFNFDSALDLGKLGLGISQFNVSKDALESEQDARDELRAQTRDDRAYNDEVRDRARNLRF